MSTEPQFEAAPVRDCLILTVHVAVDDLPSALVEAKTLVESLASHAKALICNVERYWKIPEHYVLVLDFGGEDRIARFETLCATLAQSWSLKGGHSDDMGAVWDHRADEGFVLTSARWAYLNSFVCPNP